MRARLPITAVALMLAVTGLAGCRTNVGTALRIDGHRISESTISSYVTPDAKSVSVPVTKTKSIQASPRSIVAQTLIDLVSYPKIIALASGRLPTSAQLQQIEKTVLAGKTPEQFANSKGITGYSSGFDAKFVERQAYNMVLTPQTSSQEAVLERAVGKIKISVSVSPRYGTWNRSSLSILGSNYQGLPSYLTLQTPAS